MTYQRSIHLTSNSKSWIRLNLSTVSETYQYDQQKRRLSKEYRNRKLTIDVLSDPILQVAVCSGLLISGLSLTISRFASTIVTWESGRVAVYAVIFLAFLFALELPVAWYEGFRIDHEFGCARNSRVVVTHWLSYGSPFCTYSCGMP